MNRGPTILALRSSYVKLLHQAQWLRNFKDRPRGAELNFSIYQDPTNLSSRHISRILHHFFLPPHHNGIRIAS